MSHYAPEVPVGLGPEASAYLQRELDRISAAFNALEAGGKDIINVAPDKPRDGDFRFADGINWDPGEGRGVYLYDAAYKRIAYKSELFVDPMTTRGDLLHRDSSNVTARLAIDAANQVLRSDGTDPFWGLVPVIRGHIGGLTVSNNSADAAKDIDIAVGECADSTNAALLKLTSLFTKQIDATWAVGTAAGGLFSGTVAATTWYHVFIIEKDSDGSIDCGFDTSVTAANIPVGYTKYRRIGSVKTDGTPNILGFNQFRDRFRLNATINNIAAGGSGGGAALIVSCPLGVSTIGIFTGSLTNAATGTNFAYLSPLDANNEAAAAVRAQIAIGNTINGTNYGASEFQVKVDTNSQIRQRVTSGTLWVNTLGWIDDRGRNA